MRRLAAIHSSALLVALATMILIAGLAMAQDLPTGKTIPNTPSEMKTGATPVAVIHDNVDQLGARLAYQLKETFNASSLFTLTSKDEAKIKLIVATKPEFPSRPQVGSVYSVVWIFSASENVLTHYLASEAGTVDAATVAAAAEALAGRTTAVADQYAYLFE
ncbi:hypothetical protein [Desulfovibrio ferrophilus]|uniref:Uncharacterized protein n=1 Tax=Desulfovibrio ferrophilus TaxID=241368 RepID=A0A2Z6AUC7_9BACT|nr:hypothetical protein [Desulfovibrio ferrophilus]BBD06834.1 uncharacterized protein DFE_0108 [Desulfovibrio ferrophilus]